MSREERLYIDGSVSALWRCDLKERPVERLDYEYDPGIGKTGTTKARIYIEPHAVETILIEFDRSAS